jgi:hypothetical protein
MKWGDATYASVHEAKQRLADARRVSEHNAQTIAQAKGEIARARATTERWKGVLKASNKKLADAEKKIRAELALIAKIEGGQ